MSEKSMAVLRFAKIKDTHSLRGALAHNLRVQQPSNADQSKKHLNGIPKDLNSIEACTARFDKLLDGKTVRKNAVLAHEVIVTGSHEALSNMTPAQQKAYFRDALEWLSKLHGGANRLISVAIHYDEHTPHLHAIFVPIDSKNKLNSRAILGGHASRLSELQTAFAEEVSVKHGLERGLKHSKARHTTVKQYGAMIERDLPKMQEQLTRLTAEVDQKLAQIAELDVALSNFSKRFMQEIETYYRAAETSPRLADWQRVQQSYGQMAKNAQNALQSVLEQGQKFDEKHISPFKNRR